MMSKIESFNGIDRNSQGLSSILFFDKNDPKLRAVCELIGATLSDNPALLGDPRFDVVLLPVHMVETYLQTTALSRSAIIILGKQDKQSKKTVWRLLEHTSIFSWVEATDSPEFTPSILQAIDHSQEARQATQSLALYNEYNLTLQRLSTELEKRIADRRVELSESTQRLKLSQRRSEIMHHALNAVHFSSSITEIENQLTQILQVSQPRSRSLKESPGIDWVRITFASQSSLSLAPVNIKSGVVFSVSLGPDSDIHFGRVTNVALRPDEKTFLSAIAEAAGLAVKRLRSLDRMARIKYEWEETFNAITHPIAVLDKNLRLIRGNQALLKGRQPEKVVGRPCYEAVFNRKDPCPGCPVMADYLAGKFQLGADQSEAMVRPRQFQIETPATPQPGHAEVSSRPLFTHEASANDVFLVHIYRDITATAQLEKRIIESSKMAELGTIGSSIAHQLNNPIAGMLSHIQLLLMELKTENFDGRDELLDELTEMESGTKRCAEIVRDLLGFSRRADEAEPHEHDLFEIISQAIKITELQTRSRGVRFQLPQSESDFLISARFNLLAQAFRSLLLTLLPRGTRDFTVPIEIIDKNERYEIHIGPIPNAVLKAVSPSPDRSGLDLKVAEQIIAEHDGHLVRQSYTLPEHSPPEYSPPEYSPSEYSPKDSPSLPVQVILSLPKLRL